MALPPCVDQSMFFPFFVRFAKFINAIKQCCDIIPHWLSLLLIFIRFKNGLAYHISSSYPKFRLRKTSAVKVSSKSINRKVPLFVTVDIMFTLNLFPVDFITGVFPFGLKLVPV